MTCSDRAENVKTVDMPSGEIILMDYGYFLGVFFAIFDA